MIDSYGINAAWPAGRLLLGWPTMAPALLSTRSPHSPLSRSHPSCPQPAGRMAQLPDQHQRSRLSHLG